MSHHRSPAVLAAAGQATRNHVARRAAEAALDVATCRVCGCTDEFGCPEGCWWVPDPAIAVSGDVCSICAPVINPLESWDGHVPCPTSMGQAAHLCADKAKHADQYGRVRVHYDPPEVAYG